MKYDRSLLLNEKNIKHKWILSMIIRGFILVSLIGQIMLLIGIMGWGYHKFFNGDYYFDGIRFLLCKGIRFSLLGGAWYLSRD